MTIIEDPGARTHDLLLEGAPEAYPSLVEPLRRGSQVGTPLHVLEDVRDAPTPGSARRAVERRVEAFREAFKASGMPDSVETCSLVTVPYPVRFGFWRAGPDSKGMLAITNRMLVVRWHDPDGTRRTLLFEPSDIELGGATPFYAQLAEATPDWVNERFTTVRGTVVGHLARLGIRPEEVDYLVYDHLHTQDVRRHVGTTAPQADLGGTVVEPLFPNAKLLVQRDELAAMTDLSPLQRPWYLPWTFKDVRPGAIEALDGDVQLGPGVAILATPGHTFGNQTLVLNTSTGVWAVSENVVAAECLVPQHSRIPKLAERAEQWHREVVLNANTIELAGQQYVSCLLEKSLVDPSRKDPRFPQFFPSSELTRVWWSPRSKPTFTHDAITHRV